MLGVGQVDAHRLGQRVGLAQAGLALELGEVGVHRELGALVHVEGAVAGGVVRVPGRRHRVGAVAVHEVVLRDVDLGRGVELRRGRQALLESGGEHEDLEGRPGLEAAGVAVLVVHDVVEERLALLALPAHRSRLRDAEDLAGARLRPSRGRRWPGRSGSPRRPSPCRRRAGSRRSTVVLIVRPPLLISCARSCDRLAERRVGEQVAAHVVAEEGGVGAQAAVAAPA